MGRERQPGHVLVIERALRPLFGFFQADTLPVGYYANAGDFDGTSVLNAEVYSRIEVGLHDALSRLELLTNPQPLTAPGFSAAATQPVNYEFAGYREVANLENLEVHSD